MLANQFTPEGMEGLKSLKSENTQINQTDQLSMLGVSIKFHVVDTKWITASPSSEST